MVADGTLLSVTGEAGALAEVHGGNRTRLFEVLPGGGLTLTGLKLSGGSAADGGAAYSHYANLTFDNCTFDGSIAIDGEGGAVWARRAHVTIEGGELLDNNANRYGGAVHAVDGRLKIQGGSRFEGNQANKGGGALFCGRGEPGSNKPLPLCSMTDAAFVCNSVCPEDQHDDDDEYGDPLTTTSAGGAALFMLAVVDITNSVFSGNYTANSGEALNGGFETSMVVTGCLFGNNTAGGCGGAILASFMTLGGGTQLMDN